MVFHILFIYSGDPRIYELRLTKIGKKCEITFNGDDSLSYFANDKSLWGFFESKLYIH